MVEEEGEEGEAMEPSNENTDRGIMKTECQIEMQD